MDYDVDISDSVSLSRILDFFIEDDEKPETIFRFLHQHRQDIDNIIYSSLLAPRVFCLQYVATLSVRDLHYMDTVMADGMCETPLGLALIWQVLAADNIDEFVKNTFRRHLYRAKAANTKPGIAFTRHPYSGKLGKDAERMEIVWRDAELTLENVMFGVNAMTPADYNTWAGNLGHSLFLHRVLQSDVFEMLSTKRKIIFLDVAPLDVNSHIVLKFYMQLVSDHSLPLDYRMEIISRIKISNFVPNLHIPELGEDRMIDLYPYSRMMMELTLKNLEDRYGEIIMHKILTKDKKFLLDALELDKTRLENEFDVVDVIGNICGM